MKFIDWLIKKLVNFKYKKDPFLAWSWSVDSHTDINIISEEFHMDHYRFGTRIYTFDTDEEKNK